MYRIRPYLFSSKRLRTVGVLAALLVVGACSGLAGEPQIVATIPALPTAAPTQAPVIPVSAPDLALGQQIYAARCTRCHGIGGKGDGPLVGTGAEQIPAPRDFTDPATTRDQTPLDWYNTITNGRLEKLMPPWRDALTEAERWAVAMYTYTLSYQPEQIARGQQIWTEQTGAISRMPTQSQLIQWTDSQLVEQLAQTLGGQVADYVESLDEAARAAVASYLRTTTLSNVQVIGSPLPDTASVQPQPAATEEAGAAASLIGSISGMVMNGTNGASVPSDLVITLRQFDPEFNVQTRETSIAADNTFDFADVTLREGYTYAVTTRYQDRVFWSDLVQADPNAGTLSLPLTIYELTDDPTVIRIQGMVTQIIASGDELQIAQVVNFDNRSDRLYSASEQFGEGQFASVRLALPQGARILGFAQDEQRYRLSDDQTTVTDTAPVLPGSGHIMHVIYSLPYSGDLQIEQALFYPVEGAVRLLVTPDTLSVNSDMLPAIGPQTLRNTTFQGYGAELNLPAGSTLRYRLVGQAAAATAGTNVSAVPASALIPLLLIVGGAVVIGLGLFIFVRERRSARATQTFDQQTLIDGLIRQIAELDEAHGAGDIEEATYHKRRQRLKARLAELMDED